MHQSGLSRSHMLACNLLHASAGENIRHQVEKKVDHHWAVLHCLHAVQHGQGQYEHCHSANGRTVWMGHSHHRRCAIIILLVCTLLLGVVPADIIIVVPVQGHDCKCDDC